MNTISIFTLKALRKLYSKCFGTKNVPKPECEQAPDKAAQIIYNGLISEKPYMIARFGSTEMACLGNYIGIKNITTEFFIM